MIRYFTAAAAAALAFTATPALAQDMTPVAIGSWAVMPMTPTMCQAIAGFDDEVYLSIGQDKGRNGKLVLVRQDWPLTVGQTVPGTWSTDGFRTSNPVTLTAVQLKSGAWMLHTDVDTKFGAAVGAARQVAIRVPAVKLEYRFEIPEAPQLLTEIQTCVGKLPGSPQ